MCLYCTVLHCTVLYCTVGKVAWRLKQFEKSKSMQEAEDEARRVEQLVAQQAEKERRKRIRKSNKEKKARAMAVLRALKPDTLFV